MQNIDNQGKLKNKTEKGKKKDKPYGGFTYLNFLELITYIWQ